MPKLTRWFIKTAFGYLLLSLLLSIVQAICDLKGFVDLSSALTPVSLHFFMLGWVAQLIFGVAHWMFPKASKEHPRGNEKRMWICYITLNIGLLIRGIGEPAQVLTPHRIWEFALFFSVLFQLNSAILFTINLWKRVRVK